MVNSLAVILSNLKEKIEILLVIGVILTIMGIISQRENRNIACHWSYINNYGYYYLGLCCKNQKIIVQVREKIK